MDTIYPDKEEVRIMSKYRAPYAPEFRQQIVDLVHAGRCPEELSKEFGPSTPTIYGWVAQADRDAGTRHDGLTSTEHEELSRLRRENRQLKLEREILAKKPQPGSRGRPAR